MRLHRFYSNWPASAILFQCLVDRALELLYLFGFFNSESNRLSETIAPPGSSDDLACVLFLPSEHLLGPSHDHHVLNWFNLYLAFNCWLLFGFPKLITNIYELAKIADVFVKT